MKNYLPYLWILIFCSMAIILESPTKVASADGQNFSATNAEPHIKKMAFENHFMGTNANSKVRDYILNEFEKINVPAEIFEGHTHTNYRGKYHKLAKTENIIATIKGSGDPNLKNGDQNKSVLIAGHYDSVLSAPGAADDVHAVACMIESAKLLKKQSHINDIIFLITDGEEMGLLGAKAFVESQDLSNIGLVLNYEARGNSGASISFEWSDGNAWLVNQVKKAGRRPVTSSLSYEIYNRLPNDTDFTYFKKAGLSGINHAFIDGFSYYHNPVDNPETINMNSVQHTGENMYSLVKHFANIDLSNTKTHNASFFNFLSSLISYPSSWDLIILILTFLLVGFTIFKIFKNKLTTLKPVLWAFLNLILTAVALGLAMYLLSKFLFKLYPQYDIFYSGQFYNHKLYLLTTIGLTVLIFWLRIRFFKIKENYFNLKIGALLILLIFTTVVFILLPTATYFLSLPTLALSTIVLLQTTSWIKNKHVNNAIPYLLVIISLAIWSPVVTNLFLAFSLKMLIGPAILTWLICLGTFVAFEEIWTKHKILPALSTAVILGSLIWAHLTSKPTSEKPIPSSLVYNFNVDTQKATWFTNDSRTNIGNQDIMENAEVNSISIPQSVKRWTSPTKINPHIHPTIVTDSLTPNQFKLIYEEEVFQTRLYSSDIANLKSITINGEKAILQEALKNNFIMEIYGLTQDSLQIEVEKIDSEKEIELTINSRFMGLPIKDVIPENARRRDGYTSIVRTVKF